MTKILVIEDEAEVRNSIVDILESCNYATIAAENGKQALDIVEKDIPDLVISDVMMPYLNGFKVLDEFQKRPATSSIPFIFLTARIDNDDIRKGMGSGADDYIIKPFKAKELLATIDMRLKKKSICKDKITEITTNISRHVPHELRTPLVSILGFSQILIEEGKEIDKSEILEISRRINYSGRRLHKTIEKFIVYSDLEVLSKDYKTMQTLLKEESYISNEQIREIAANRFCIPERVDDIRINVEEAVVHMFYDHFKFAVDEILENSVKFTKPGTIVRINGRVEKGSYILEAIDFGMGMTREQIVNIAPFIQHQRNLVGQNGNGLGLVIVSKIMELYKGSVKIESELNKFTRVRLVFPLK